MSCQYCVRNSPPSICRQISVKIHKIEIDFWLSIWYNDKKRI